MSKLCLSSGFGSMSSWYPPFSLISLRIVYIWLSFLFSKRVFVGFSPKLRITYIQTVGWSRWVGLASLARDFHGIVSCRPFISSSSQRNNE